MGNIKNLTSLQRRLFIAINNNGGEYDISELAQLTGHSFETVYLALDVLINRNLIK